MLKHRVYLLLGSNLGDRFANLELAKKFMELLVGKVTLCSSIYETAAWGFKDQPDFLNQVFLMETNLLPKEILDCIRVIENQLGRNKTAKWGPRTMDVDILFYDDLIIDSPELTIPHHNIENRKFVLVPLNEIASEFIHPLLKKTTNQLLTECEDNLSVKDIKFANEV